MLGLVNHPSHNVLITAGAGFIGTNLAAHLLATTTARITLCDNLTSPGSQQNYAWLMEQAASERVRLVPEAAVQQGFGKQSPPAQAALAADEIYHLACARAPQSLGGQLTAFTKALLEAARRSRKNPVVVFVSSRNVSGAVQVTPSEATENAAGEACPLNDHNSVAACAPCDSHSAAEHLVSDYAQIYGLPAVALRFDTVAGPRQFAEDNDWVAQLVYSILNGRPMTVRGSLNQVHDVLHVADAVEAMLAARAYIGITAGKVYDVGGGTQRCVAVLDLVHSAERACNRAALIRQQRAARESHAGRGIRTWPFRIDAGWQARRSVDEAVRDMVTFWRANRSIPAAPDVHAPASVNVQAA